MSMSGADTGGSALARALKRSLNMKAGWSETFSWSDEAQQVVDRYDELRTAFERVGAKVTPAFAGDWRAVTAAIANIDRQRITNTTEAREAARAEVNRQLTAVQRIEERIDAHPVAVGQIRDLTATRMGSAASDALAPLLTDLDHRVLARLTDQLSDVAGGEYPWSTVCRTVCSEDSGLSPAEALGRLKEAMTHLPTVPSRAGMVEGSGSGLTIGRDDDGKVVVLNQALAFTGVPIPEANKNLSPDRIAQIQLTFTQTVSANYSRHGVALDFMAHVRTKRQEALEADLPQPPLALLMKTFDAADPDRAAKYGGGDCMVLAETLADQLRQQGLEARVAGFLNPALTGQRIGANQRFPSDAGVVSCGMTHADVIVPYTTEDGEERVMILVPGMGPDDQYRADLSLADYMKDPMQRTSEAGMMVQQSAGKHMVGPDGGDLDVSRMEKEQLHFLTNIQITDSLPGTNDKQLCGIDMMAGKVYLNGRASTAFEGLRQKEAGSVSLDMKALLAKADEMVQMRLPNPETGELEIVEVRGIEALGIALEGIGQQFGQPDDFVANILTLAENLDEYRATVVSPDVRALYQ